MSYSSHWEALLQDEMTLEDMLCYPVRHVRFHLQHSNYARSDGGE